MTDHKVTDIRDRWTSEQAQSADARRDKARRDGDNGGNGGEPPMSDLTVRVERLESSVSDIKVTLARMEEKQGSFATSEELHKEMGGLRAEMHSLLRQQTMWSVGTIIAMASLVFAIMRFLPA